MGQMRQVIGVGGNGNLQGMVCLIPAVIPVNMILVMIFGLLFKSWLLSEVVRITESMFIPLYC